MESARVITACVRYHHDYKQAGEWATGGGGSGPGRKICGHWGLGRKHPVDLSEDVPVDKFQGILDDLGLPAEKWDQVIWDIRQNLVGLDGIFREDPD